MNKYLIGSLLVLTTIISCNTPPQKEVFVQTTSPITATDARYAKIDSAQHYELDLVYPLIDGELESDVLNKINNTIGDRFYSYAKQNDFIEAHQDLPEHFYNDDSEYYGLLKNTYRITQCDSVLGVWFSVYQYYLGAAHGFTLQYAVYFNLNNGDEIQSTDFFRTDEKSLQQIGSIFNNHLPDTICWGVTDDSTALESIKNPVFLTDSISFKLNDYSLCAYAYGFTTVTIAKSEFDSLLTGPATQNCNEIFPVIDESEIAMH